MPSPPSRPTRRGIPATFRTTHPRPLSRRRRGKEQSLLAWSLAGPKSWSYGRVKKSLPIYPLAWPTSRSQGRDSAKEERLPICPLARPTSRPCGRGRRKKESLMLFPLAMPARRKKGRERERMSADGDIRPFLRHPSVATSCLLTRRDTTASIHESTS